MSQDPFDSYRPYRDVAVIGERDLPPTCDAFDACESDDEVDGDE